MQYTGVIQRKHRKDAKGECLVGEHAADLQALVRVPGLQRGMTWSNSQASAILCAFVTEAHLKTAGAVRQLVDYRHS